MPVHTLDRDAAAPTPAPVERPLLRRFALVAVVSAVYSYLLVLFGGLVRITGSGLGCGDDWPLCNGRLLPPWDVPTWIEWTHRLLAAGLVVPVAILGYYAIARRHEPGMGGPGGAARPALLAIALLAVQAALGAVTVKLDLPAGVTALHFVNAMLLLAALVVAVVRAAGGGPSAADAAAARKFSRAATAAAGLGLVVITFGALTANTGLDGATTAPSAAAWACQGFPLCNGRLVPAGEPLVHIHWSHRLFAFLLLFHVLGAVIVAFRRGAPRAVARAAAASLGLAIAQVAVAAGLVLFRLPQGFRALHLVVGVALWMALASWAALARRAALRPFDA